MSTKKSSIVGKGKKKIFHYDDDAVNDVMLGGLTSYSSVMPSFSPK